LFQGGSAAKAFSYSSVVFGDQDGAKQKGKDRGEKFESEKISSKQRLKAAGK